MVGLGVNAQLHQHQRHQHLGLQASHALLLGRWRACGGHAAARPLMCEAVYSLYWPMPYRLESHMLSADRCVGWLAPPRGPCDTHASATPC